MVPSHPTSIHTPWGYQHCPAVMTLTLEKVNQHRLRTVKLWPCLRTILKKSTCQLIMFYQTRYLIHDRISQNLRAMQPAGPGPGGDGPSQDLPKEPEVMVVEFPKVNGSMGLSIVAAKVRKHFLSFFFSSEKSLVENVSVNETDAMIYLVRLHWEPLPLLCLCKILTNGRRCYIYRWCSRQWQHSFHFQSCAAIHWKAYHMIQLASCHLSKTETWVFTISIHKIVATKFRKFWHLFSTMGFSVITVVVVSWISVILIVKLTCWFMKKSCFFTNHSLVCTVTIVASCKTAVTPVL